MMDGKVAFVALTYSDWKQTEFMEKWFDETVPGWSLYIHPKERLRCPVFQKYVIDQKMIVPTNWGQYSLVEATCNLLRVALRDPENRQFVLISDSHLPVNSMAKTLEVLESFPGICCSSSPKTLVKNRFLKMMNASARDHQSGKIPYKLEHAVFVSQWFVCDRSAAEAFVAAEEKYRGLFKPRNVSLADEMWFSMTSNMLKLAWNNKMSCYYTRELETSRTLIQAGHRKLPCTWDSIPDSMILEMRKKSIPFIRKVCDVTKFNPVMILNDTLA